MTEAEQIAADIREEGQLMTLSRSTPGVINPAKGRIDDPINQEWEVYGIKGKLGSITAAGSNYTRLDSTIQAGDALYLMEAGKVTPQAGDTLTAASVTWTVQAVDALSPAGVDLLYYLHVRR